MRVFFSCIAALCFSVPLFSQNVGIGTTTPAFPLDVRTTANGTIMRLFTAKDSVGASTLLRFTTTATPFSLGDKSSYVGNLRSGAGYNLVFGTSSNNEALMEHMRLNYIGFLGLGTANPLGRLHIDMSNTASDNAIIINDDEDPQVELHRNNTAMGFWQLVNNNVRIGTTVTNNTGSMILRTNGGDRIMVSPTGEVRMGNLSEYNLRFIGNEVQSFYNGNAAEMVLQRNGGKLEVGNLFDFATTKLQINSGVDVGLAAANSGYLMIGLSNGINIVADNNEIQARNEGRASDLFFQHAGGNVRIGNGAFGSTHRLGVTGDAVVTGNLRVGAAVLPPGYSFGVDGRVICTEVMVRTVPNWPDYVFDKKYTLKKLDELEKFIQKNKHLPGIPTAQQIEQEGLSLSEMQRLQMEKIEELTLYIIGLKKELEDLKQQRKKQKQ